MAEALAIECPPTPEGQIDFPATPPAASNARIREFLKTQKRHKKPHGDTESGNSDDEQHRLQDNASPPPNCSICLGRVKSKCFTNSCMHQFCFSCLLEWSKIKPECPLCKQTFKSIIHNVTSMDNYEEYKVEQHQHHVTWNNITSYLEPINFIFSPTLSNYRVFRPELAAHNRIYQLFLHESPGTERFARLFAMDSIPPRHSGASWRAYVYRRRLYSMPLNDISGQSRIISAAFYRENPAQMHRIISWMNRELVCLCTSSQYPVSEILRNMEELIQTYDMNSSAFRRRVRTFIPQHCDHFVHELLNYARSPYDIVGYDRNVMYTPVFDDDDEVVALSSSDESDVSVVIASGEMTQNNRMVTNAEGNRINNVPDRILLIPGQNGVPQFVQTATPSAQNNRPTAIVNSADNNTPFNLSANVNSISNNYTSGAIVRPQVPVPSALAHILNSSEEDTDEDEIATYLTPNPVVNMDTIRGRTGSPARDATTVIVYGDNSNAETTAMQNTSATITTSTTSIVTTTINVGGIESEATTMTTTTASISNVQVVEEDSDSDDCLFVCAKKPPHLRTPEFVELNSDSDSDVVFVNEEKLPEYQVIKKEDSNKGNNSSSNTNNNNVIVAPQKKLLLSATANTTASSSSTNIVVSNARRKRRHGDHESRSATKDENAERKPLSSTSSSINLNTTDDISNKPSTSSGWFDKLLIYPNSSNISLPYASIDSSSCTNRPNAIVFNSSASATKRSKISLVLPHRNRTNTKPIFESSSSEQSDDNDDDDVGVTSSSPSSPSSPSSAASKSSSESSSSSHEEYNCARKTLKRKSLKPASTRKKYYKKTILSGRKRTRSARKSVDKKTDVKKSKTATSTTLKLNKRRKGKSRPQYICPSTTSSSSEYDSDY